MRSRGFTRREWAAALLGVLVFATFALAAQKGPAALAGPPMNQTIPTPTSVEMAVTPPDGEQAGQPSPPAPPSAPGVPTTGALAPSTTEALPTQGPPSATGNAPDTLAPESTDPLSTEASTPMQGLYCLWVAVGLLLMAAGLGIVLRRRRSP